LIFVPPEYHLSIDDEKKRYALHHNTPNDPEYVRYLAGVADAALRLPLPPRARVLDFGCGEHAVLAGILKRRGWECAACDPLYSIGGDALRRMWDLIVACEVLEHMRDLRAGLAALGRALAPGGRLVVRTELYAQESALLSWWYAQDATHMNFFHASTAETIAGLVGGGVERSDGKNTLVFRKTG
jgi:2-polyprenyl-3-methyl-5-hydroxy-6-metoxy-1,4-benzoquinol methylase